MAKLIVSSVYEVKYKADCVLTNNPINLEIVAQILKTRKQYYPDNNGIPSITFIISPQFTVEWVYPLGQDELRDSDYINILMLFGTNLKDIP